MMRVINFRNTISFLILISTIFFLSDIRVESQPPIQPPGLDIAMEVQEAHTSGLMADPDVVGTAVGLNRTGEAVIQVFVESEGVRGIPRNLEGFDVVVKVTGPIVAYKRPSSAGGSSEVSHKAKQTPPIQLGTSGGWRYDLANGYCCGGTLGALVQIGATKYILSNWHVLYSDIVNGGNNRTWQPGDPVIQPGLIDVSCNQNNAQNVASLVNGGGSLPDGNVDAGIAKIIEGMVDESGAILEIGTISSRTVEASIGQNVKKSGGTTGLSRSRVDGLNATVRISYEDECAGRAAFEKTFTGQIVIENRNCKFLNGGESGSLMVEDVDNNPKAVGLLYAGSAICYRYSVAIANPIDEVLNYFGASMVGN